MCYKYIFTLSRWLCFDFIYYAMISEEWEQNCGFHVDKIMILI